jgi:uncharacterized membrane protein YphA (DoxX/SURF4 family)
MRVRDRVGLNLPPLLLRLTIGAIVLWMGLGKILETYEVQPTEAAILANMGAIKPSPSPSAPPSNSPPTAPSPATTPATPPTSTPDKPSGGSAAATPSIHLASQATQTRYSALDFPNPVRVRKLYTIALAIHAAANPGSTPSGTTRSPLWPASLGNGEWPMYLAWTCAIGESLAGVGLIIGLLTRWWALLIAGRFLVALWVSHIGPATQSADALFGFLPNHATFDYEKWRPLVHQTVLAVTALALLFLGPGRASLDHAVFAKPRPDDDDDE